MAVTRVDIINDALARSSVAALQSEAAAGTEKLLRFYAGALREMLGYKKWTFARKVLSLPRDATAAVPGRWTYSFQLPPDRSGSIISVMTTADGEPITNFEIMGDRLLSDETVIFVQYRGEPDPWTWSPLFRECMTVLLQAQIMLSIREDKQSYQMLRRQVLGDEREPGSQGMIHAARTEDAQGSASQVVALSGGPLLDAHRRGYRSDIWKR